MSQPAPAQPPAPSPQPSIGLVSMLHVDQVWRWRQGERVAVEDYLARHPELAEAPEALLDLVWGEVLLRQDHGEPARLEDYLARFPALASPLRRKFAGDRAPPGEPEATQ